MVTAFPTPRQLEFQDWELGVFLHFGVRTFHEGHRDWDGKPMSARKFNPTALDCNQWVKIAKKAGVRYMVLTAKHHDGFANWPSKSTHFSVASSPWKNGKGDVIREFTDACQSHGMKIGLYYSPADVSCPVYKDEKAYDDYFITQISEILTGYGEIDMLWFDGCGSEGHEYDWPRIIGEIRKMQPNILIYLMGDPDYRWVGNEVGIAPLPSWNTVEQKWLPVECPCKMRFFNWFYSDSDEDTVKSVEELMGLYYSSVGRGCNLLINIGPDRRGLLPEKDASRLIEFGEEIRRRFTSPIATLKDCKEKKWRFIYRPTKSPCIDFTLPVLVDHVIIQEDLIYGEHVRKFNIDILPTPDGHLYKPITVFKGENIGHKAICRFPLVRTEEITLDITEADDTVRLRSLEFYNTCRT